MQNPCGENIGRLNSLEVECVRTDIPTKLRDFPNDKIPVVSGVTRPLHVRLLSRRRHDREEAGLTGRRRSGVEIDNGRLRKRPPSIETFEPFLKIFGDQQGVMGKPLEFSIDAPVNGEVAQAGRNIDRAPKPTMDLEPPFNSPFFNRTRPPEKGELPPAG